MSQGRREVLDESKKNGLVAGSVTAATVAASVLLTPYIVVIGAPAAAYYGYKWWKHRASNGIRF